MLRLIAIALLVTSFGLTACNTVEGVGEDLETAGQTIDQGASGYNQ